jgi:protein-S-isoprenylcysteine O-methyltransferase Ste14
MRRYGINLSFAFTVLAQILTTNALAREPRVPAALRQAMVALCLALLLLGLASLPLQYFTTSRSPAMNAVEWTFSVLMLVFFPLIGAAWRRTGFAPEGAPTRPVRP